MLEININRFRSFLVIIFLFSKVLNAEITKEEFVVVSEALQKAYSQINIDINPKLAGENFWWNQEQKRASYSKFTNSQGKTVHNLFFFGGLARMPEMTVEGAALILCHELGHGFGGEPKKLESESSVEGQADYFATRYCMPLVLENIPVNELIPEDPLAKCRTDTCRRIYIGIRSEMAVLNQTRPGKEASFEKTDSFIAPVIIKDPTFYPSNQCRLDTLVAGALELERPRCWWVPTATLN